MSAVINLSILFYVLFNAPGSIPVFVALLKTYSSKKRQNIILRESILALITLILFSTFGNQLFCFLDISLYSFQLIGGILLMSVALGMMLAPPIVKERVDDDSEPIFYPLAFPVITGPAVITSVLGCFIEGNYPKDVILIAIFIAWFASLLTLFSSSWFDYFLGPQGLLALERLFGIALLLMSTNLILKGLSMAFSIGYYYLSST